jgi:hypothetical protein
LVEKRTFVFVILATIVWAALASTFAGYYYFQNKNSTEQLGNAQNSLNKVASSYNEAVNKYDLLLSEYASLYGNYSYFTSNDYATLMPPLGSLIADSGKNYTNLFAEEDMNKTYNHLLSDYEALLQKGNVTKADFGNLLNEYYSLFNLSALRELGLSVSEAATLSVNVEINYGNGTVEWHNETNVPAGHTLLKLTQEVAVINYSYYAFAEPGHVLVDSINNETKYTDPSYGWGYSWIWYYWSDSEKTWVSGPVGCDSWLLRDGGIYRWNYERWSFPSSMWMVPAVLTISILPA